MPGRKRAAGKGFLLLDKKSKTYTEFSDKKALLKKLIELIESGKLGSDFAIIHNKEVSFDIGFTIYLKERAPRRKKIAARKPRTAKRVAKATPRAARKPRTKPAPTPAEEKKLTSFS